MLSRILDSTSAETIRQHLLDFDLRNMLPGHPRKNAGWLAKAILVPYALHDRTHEQIESGKKLTQAQLHRQKQATTKAAEDARLAAIDAWAEEQFSSADDEELELLRAKVIAEYGSVARGLEKVDARTHPRLSRLIKGVLSQLYQG